MLLSLIDPSSATIPGYERWVEYRKICYNVNEPSIPDDEKLSEQLNEVKRRVWFNRMRINAPFTRKIVTVEVALCDMEVMIIKFLCCCANKKTRKLTIGEGSNYAEQCNNLKK